MRGPLQKARIMTETEAAWLAGFVDGEGSVGVYRRPSRHANFANDFGVRVVLVNTNEEAMKYVRLLTGCGSAWRGSKPRNPKWRTVYRWQAVGENARDVVRQLIPYLRVKRAIAELVLSMPVNVRGAGRTDESYAEQSRIFTEAKSMNRRGVFLQ